MSEEEVLCRDSDLYRYLIKQGFTDIGTFKPEKLDFFEHSEGHLISNKDQNDATEPVPISAYDYCKLKTILDSKLLLVEDFELIELFLSNTAIYYELFDYKWFLGALSVSISAVAYFRKGFYFNIGLSTLLSFATLWKVIRKLKDFHEHNILANHICFLQKLCLHTHKLLRFLRETEILSTGQVSTYNVGSAMYIPTNNTIDLSKCPSWKTLPHLRRCLADAILFLIDTFSSTSDVIIQESLPSWIAISGYTFSNKSLLEESQCVRVLNSPDSCISIKDLQCLCEIYLKLQSEYLRWIAIVIYDFNQKNSKKLRNRLSIKEYVRIRIVNILQDIELKLSNVSFKLSMQCKIQNMFSNVEDIALHKSDKSVKDTSLVKTQSDLHNIFLTVLSLMVHVRNLEDRLEITMFDVKNTNMNCLKEQIITELDSIRNNLILAVNAFDDICEYSNLHRKIGSACDEDLLNKSTENKYGAPKTQIDIKNNLSTTFLNDIFSDEVFLAVTNSSFEDKEMNDNDWCVEKKPEIPKSLLTELSSTLEPIKRDFKERERLALARSGLEDFEIDSTEDINLMDKQVSSSSIFNENKETRNQEGQTVDSIGISIQENEPLKLNCNGGDDLTDYQLKDSTNDSNQNDCENRESFKECKVESFTFNNSELANVIATKSKSWGIAKEECFYDG